MRLADASRSPAQEQTVQHQGLRFERIQLDLRKPSVGDLAPAPALLPGGEAGAEAEAANAKPPSVAMPSNALKRAAIEIRSHRTS